MPGICRIVAGVSGSPGSVHALRQAADLARHHDALLIPLHAWVPPEGDIHERKHPCPQLRQLWHDDAWQRLWEALDTAFGGLPAGIATQPVVRRGQPGRCSPRGPPARRPAGDRHRPPGPAAAAGVLPRQPLLPGPRPLPGAGDPAPRVGPGSRPWPARLGQPPPPGPGHGTAFRGQVDQRRDEAGGAGHTWDGSGVTVGTSGKCPAHKAGQLAAVPHCKTASAKAEHLATGPSGGGYLSSFLTAWSDGTGSRRGQGLSSGLNRGFPPWLEAGSCLHTGLNSWGAT